MQQQKVDAGAVDGKIGINKCWPKPHYEQDIVVNNPIWGAICVKIGLKIM